MWTPPCTAVSWLAWTELVPSGQSMAAVSRSLGIVEQTLFNWVKASREGGLTGADSKPVSAEQMESAGFVLIWPGSRWSATSRHKSHSIGSHDSADTNHRRHRVAPGSSW